MKKSSRLTVSTVERGQKETKISSERSQDKSITLEESKQQIDGAGKSRGNKQQLDLNQFVDLMKHIEKLRTPSDAGSSLKSHVFLGTEET